MKTSVIAWTCRECGHRAPMRLEPDVEHGGHDAYCVSCGAFFAWTPGPKPAAR